MNLKDAGTGSCPTPVDTDRTTDIPVCLKSKCTDFPMDELATWHLVDVYQRVGSDLGCMLKLVSAAC